MKAELPEIFVLAGVTAVGKTAFSLDWAEQAGAEILSCDALLFYRGMDIGTAKPTGEARLRVPHHGIDLLEPSETFDVVRYLEYALDKVNEIHGREKRVLVVGGSGFYLKSFFTPVSDAVEVPESIRAEVRVLEQEAGLDGLVARLRETNPELPVQLDLLNPRRVSRALERCLASGETLVSMQERFRNSSGPFDAFRKRTCLLERDPVDLEQRIRTRTAAMLKQGLREETKASASEGLRENPSASRAIGYREVLSMLDGQLSLEELPGAICQATLQLAAKQRKWFRKQFRADCRLLASKEEDFSPKDFPWLSET